jgi:hypothetical protein
MNYSGTIPSWVDAIPIGEWHEAPCINLKSVDPSPQGHKTEAWNSFDFNPNAPRLYSVWPGGV